MLNHNLTFSTHMYTITASVALLFQTCLCVQNIHAVEVYISPYNEAITLVRKFSNVEQKSNTKRYY